MPLWIVATPIGSLGDLSPRARKVLGDATLIVAEDTRTTRKLLRMVGIEGPHHIEALHAHNEAQRASSVAARAVDEDVAIVSDAGTPGISDPGRLVIEACLQAGVRVLSVPGPSALASALAASGFPAAPSTFLGFPPRKGRDGWAESTLARGETLVVYESPNRITDLVRRLSALAPEREAAMCRELSKRFEEVLRAPLAGLSADLEARDTIKGECVLVIGPGEPFQRELAVVGDGASLKAIAAVLAERWGVTKREAYQRLLAAESAD